MNKLAVFCALPVVAMLSACNQVNMGHMGSKSPATGSAAGAHTEGANSQLERCSQTLGTLTIHEDRNADWYQYFYRNGVHSTVPVLRLLSQQSGCFVVVERGSGMEDAMTERALHASGELREGSNFGKGQMVSADYTLKPSLIFSDQNTGGLGGALGGVIGGSLGAAIGGSMNFKSAQGTLTLVDNRSTVQVAVSEGSSQGMDFGGMTGLFGSSAGGVLSGYSKTPEGKVVVGAMMDAYNNMVRSLRNYSAQAATGPRGHGTGGRLEIAGSQQSSYSGQPATKAINAEVKEAQTILSKMGFNVGTPDGIMGRKTRKAIESFQKMSNLAVTGSLNEATMAKLRSM